MASESKCVAEGNIDRPFLRDIESQVELGIKAFIIGEVVNGRRDNAFINSQ